jgi:hypothetical protein
MAEFITRVVVVVLLAVGKTDRYPVSCFSTICNLETRAKRAFGQHSKSLKKVKQFPISRVGIN